MRNSTKRVFAVFAGTFCSLFIFIFFVIPYSLETINEQVKLNIKTNKLNYAEAGPKTQADDYEVDEHLVYKLKSQLNKLTPKEREGCQHSTTLADFVRSQDRQPLSENTTWNKFYNEFGNCDIYRENSKTIDQLLREMNQLPITYARLMHGGSQIKLTLRFANGQRALFKPQRFPDINQGTLPDQFYFSDFERSSAEIAGFHLDRLLGFRRAVPAIGRVLDLRHLEHISEEFLKSTFFISPAKNLCFVGKCTRYCDTSHAICGTPYLVRGSLQMYLPPESYVPRKTKRSVYSRTYSKFKQMAKFQTNDNYCNEVVKLNSEFNHGRRLLDVVDTHIMDFLMGNLDRHHIQRMKIFHKDTFPLHLDNGRGFGRASEDYLDILAPLYQCCIVRPTTVSTLLRLSTGPVSFGQLFNQSLSKDPTFPVLAEQHFSALDRRISIVLNHILKCIEKADNVHDVFRNTYETPSNQPK